jgi:gliding motility-associated-like protein
LKKKIFLLILFISGSLAGLQAQNDVGNMEFVENNGQWDKAIRFKANMPNSTFYLQQHGFSVLLQSPSDMEALRHLLHGEFTEESPSGKTGADTKNRQAGQTTTLSQIKAVQVGPGGNEVPGSGSAIGSSNSGKKNPGGSNNTGSLLMHSHLYEVEFMNSSDQVNIQGDKALITYNNYFIGNDSSKWKSNCKVYQAVVYKNIYPNIDLRYYTNNGQLKYDLVVHPGGNPDNIIMKYKGADKLIVKSGQISIQTSVGNVTEVIPRSYQFSSSENKNLECIYKQGPDNTVRFQISNYSPSSTLVIDPTLVFSSFTGSHSDNWGYTATYDNEGNFYSGSITLSGDFVGDAGNGFPASPGAFQTTFQGGSTDGDDGSYQYDISILKFSSDGSKRLYATYLGGSGNEQPHSLVVDASENLIVAGRTSSRNFPSVTSTGIVDLWKGNYDIILTKFNSTGTSLIGSRIIGGSGNDGVNIAPKYSSDIVNPGQHSIRLNYGDDGRSEVILDNAGNVCLASCTSSTDFPVTGNAFQKTIGGMQDGVFIKTSPDLSVILACSYLGGNSDDAAFALSLNPVTNNFYVAGATSSNNLQGTSTGKVIYPTNQGGIDGFLSIISNDGGTLIKTSYFGTTGTDALYGVQFDIFGNPYIMGTTYGLWPVVNAAFSQAGGKQFIAKLQPDLSAFIYSTTFGKGDAYPDISPTAFLVDRCQNVYVAGWGGGIENEGGGHVYNNSTTSGLSVTSDAIKKTTDGEDFYFFVMKKDAVSQLYGSFFGENGGFSDHVDGGTSRFDKQGVIYEAICANCYGGATFPVSPNVWSTRNGTGTQGCNLAAVKIALNFAGVAADPRSLINGVYDSMGCVPLDVLLKDTIHNAKTYEWKFGDGTSDTTTILPQVLHTYTAIGTYLVRLIAIDSTSCNISDTAYLHIIVRNDKAILNFNITKLPPCQSLSYLYTNTSIPPPGKPFSLNSFTWQFGDGVTAPGTSPIEHTYAAAGPYTVSLILSDTNYCNYPDTTVQTLRVSPFVKAQFQVPDGCAPYTAVFNNTSLAGEQFFWNFGDGGSSTDINPVHIFTDTGTYAVNLLAIDSNTCNIKDDTTILVHVYPKPKSDFTFLPLPAQYNTPTVFENESTGATHFVWLFGDGNSTLKNSADTVIHQYQSTGTFNACLIAINDFGCSDTICHPVESLINPLLDVPNAFTPGRFGENSIIMVKGFGIASMDWKIFNRWGQVVFESNNPFSGWDGTYKGTPQPMDVYAYTLAAVFFDGTKTFKKGDITLIR